jgi:hypothetical protein
MNWYIMKTKLLIVLNDILIKYLIDAKLVSIPLSHSSPVSLRVFVIAESNLSPPAYLRAEQYYSNSSAWKNTYQEFTQSCIHCIFHVQDVSKRALKWYSKCTFNDR